MKKIITLSLLVVWQLIYSQSSYLINDTNYSIPDGTSSTEAGTTYSSVTFSGLPENAVITNVLYETTVNHSYHGDLAGVISTTYSGTEEPRIVLYSAGTLGSDSGDLIRNGSTSVFNNMSPNQTFYFRVWDTAPDDTGYIDRFKITVYYEIPAPTVSLNSLNSSYQVGDNMYISWTSTNQDHWEIDILEDSTQIGKILSSTTTESNTYYNWSIPSYVTDDYGNTHILDGNNYKIKIVVWNSKDATYAQTDYDISPYISITAQNTAPYDPYIYSYSSNIYANQSINISVKSGSDPDGDQTKIHVTGQDSNLTDSAPYISSWNTAATTYSIPITFYSTGEKTVYAVTYDEHGTPSNVIEKTFTVLETEDNNEPPNTATFLDASSTIIENQQTTIPIKNGDDPDGDATYIKVYYPYDNLIYTSSSSNSIQTFNVPITFTQSGEQKVYAKTFDSYGNESPISYGTYNVVAEDNEDTPSQPNFISPPSTININEVTYFNIQSGSDPNNDQVKIKLWASGSNHPLESEAIYSDFNSGGTNFSLSLTFSELGTQYIYAKTVDINGNESPAANISANIVDNTTTPTDVVIGNITFTADVINETSNGVYSLDGNVKANDILQFSGSIIVDSNNYSVSGNGRVYLSNIPSITNPSNLIEIDLYNGAFNYSLDGTLAQLKASGIDSANEMFSLVNLPVYIDKINLLSEGINIEGELELPELFGYVKTNVSQLQITRSNGIELIGDVSINQIVTPGFKLNNLNFSFDTINNTFEGEGEIETQLFKAGATVKIIETGIDQITLFLAINNPYPLGTTGLSLSGLNGSIENIQTHPDPPMIVTIGCSLTPTVQGSVDIIEFSNVSLTYQFGTSISGSGSFKILGTETANAGFEVRDGLFKINASIDFYQIVNAAIEAGIAKRDDGNIDVLAKFNSSINIPDGDGFPYDWIKAAKIELPYTVANFENVLYNNELSGKGEIGWFNVDFSYRLSYDGTFHKEFAKNFSLFNDEVFLRSQVASKIPLKFQIPDSKYTDWNSPDYNVFEGRSLKISTSIYKTMGMTKNNEITQDFVLAGETNTIIIRVRPETGSEMPVFELTAPNGDIISYSNIDSYPDAEYTENTIEHSGYYTINNPQIGTWIINIQEGSTPTYLVDVFGTKREAGIILHELQQNENNVTVSWTDDDPNYNGKIALYYNSNNENIDGTLIVSGLDEDSDVDSYNFDISNLTVGTYYVYAIMTNPDGSTYSFSPTTFTKISDIAAPENLQYTINSDNSVTFTWDKLSGDYNYLIYYQKDGEVSHSSLNYNAGNTDTFTITDLDPNHNYQVMVAAQDINNVNNIGNGSNTVDVKFSRTQTIELKEGWNLVGFNVNPVDTDMDTVFEPIKNYLEQINSQTEVYNPNLPSYLNTLTQLIPCQGYYMHMNQDTVFNVTGFGINTSGQQIELHSGWNLISYPGTSPIDVEDALESISDYVIQINSQTQVYNPSLPDYLNTLTQLEPGKGYWINVSQNCLLTY